MTDDYTDDLSLLTRARALLARPETQLIAGAWETKQGCCTVGAASMAIILNVIETRGSLPGMIARATWRSDVRRQTAKLLAPHLDKTLIAEARAAGHLSEYEADELIGCLDPRQIVTLYSDRVLSPRLDGKAKAIELYDRAIAAELASRAEVRAGDPNDPKETTDVR